MADPQVVIRNEKASGVPDAELAAMIPALQAQVEEFAVSWGRRADLSFVGIGHRPKSSAWVIAVLGTSDEAGALGYHDLTPAGLPLGKVFAATDRQYGETLSVTLSHELLEMLGDPFIDLSVQGPDGKFYAYESCDAVEADNLGYTLDGVLLSDFVTPAWFGHGGGPLDRQGHLTRPLELAPGGYIGVFDPASGQGWTQVTDERVPAKTGEEAAVKLAQSHPRVGSRRERRFRQARGGAMVRSVFTLE